MKTAVVVLAAGASSRMGEPKQLVRVGGERLLDRAMRAAKESGLRPILVVLGANAETVREACDLSDASVVLNESWALGMASSLQTGVRTAADGGAEAVVVMTADMPFVPGEHLRQLAEKAAAMNSNVASWSEGWRGIPACFLRSSFAAMEALQGDTGGRALLLHAPVLELAVGFDVDTPEELRAANRAQPKIEG